MFLFIVSLPACALFKENLNTSHVLIYHNNDAGEALLGKDLNTSHVLIYQSRKMEAHQSCGFKYISCSYLSKNHRLKKQ